MANPAEGPVVRVAGGQMRGVLANGVETYMGVPYAAAPVGDLRWRSPKPAAAWKGVHDAQKPGANCAQSEDCLFLNVWRPAGAKANAKMPVMVWIHGGSFTGGSSMNGFGANHDGTALARQGVMTVTINYRLGRAGWFSHPALTKEGQSANFGLEDQTVTRNQIDHLTPLQSISVPASPENPVEFDHVEGPPAFEAILRLTDSIEHCSKSPFPRLTGFALRYFPSIRRHAKAKDQAITEQIARAETRINQEKGDSGKVTNGLDHMMRREKQIAQKEGRAPNYYSKSMRAEVSHQTLPSA
ncbi:MAG: hypothetical protein EOO40_12685, partial [Deltaproteobacteria bacterium]